MFRFHKVCKNTWLIDELIDFVRLGGNVFLKFLETHRELRDEQQAYWKQNQRGRVLLDRSEVEGCSITPRNYTSTRRCDGMRLFIIRMAFLGFGTNTTKFFAIVCKRNNSWNSACNYMGISAL